MQQGRSDWASTRPAVCAFSGVDGVRVDRETVGCVSVDNGRFKMS